MFLYEINPLNDPRWHCLVMRHASASVFHTDGWLRSLQQTYGYKPLAFTTSKPGSELDDAILFCSLRRPFAGIRLVSLPFSDHCEPLSDSSGDVSALLEALTYKSSHLAACIEIRPLNWKPEIQVFTGFCPRERYYLHAIDLRPDLAEIFRSMHKDCIQRKIRRAEREGIEYQEGNSKELLKHFFRLFVATRRRLGVPPQPWSWFLNLSACMGTALKIRVAYKGSHPIAGIITLSHRTTMVYKYGCSDRGEANLGATPMLFWRAIEDAKHHGMLSFDLGRSDCDASGLITFKERLGSTRQVLTYATYPKTGPRHTRPLRLSKSLFRHFPEPLLVGAGRLLYRYAA